jgi:hypothetical protein
MQTELTKRPNWIKKGKQKKKAAHTSNGIREKERFVWSVSELGFILRDVRDFLVIFDQVLFAMRTSALRHAL